MDGVPGGYNGKLLRVNLSVNSIKIEELDARFLRRYIGGAGFISYYLWKELKPKTDPLGPDNKLILAAGPITGLTIPGASRNCVGAKSPLTGTIAKSESGCFWAAELKRAGFDAIIVEGKAEKPNYLYINDGEVAIKDAGHLWGKETKETQEAIRSELRDDRTQVVLIGPGGENLVLYACIMSGLYDAAGRGGLGAVMGSKNLKAIAVRGHKQLPVANNDRLKEIRQNMIKNPEPHPFKEGVGTGGEEMMYFEAVGNLPVRNFRDGLFPGVANIHGGTIAKTISIGMEGCFGCPIRCKKKVQVEKPIHVDAAYGGPEYESIAALGSNVGVSDLIAVVKSNERCNAYSIDTISAGSTIAFAMECFEKGLLTLKDTDGIDLRFGNAEAVMKCLDLIAYRQGFGNFLAEGTARMAKKIGQGTQDFAMNVKGLETAMHEPRVTLGYGLIYMLAPNGADHCANEDFLLNNPSGIKQLEPLGIFETVPPGDPSPQRMAMFRLGHFKPIIDDSLVTCSYVFSFRLQAELLQAVTGWNIGIPELSRIAERILTVSRLFNVREGFSAKDDMLPRRFFQHKTDGPLSDAPLVSKDEMEKAKKYYYTFMGWDENGVPTPEKVAELYI